MNHQAKAPTSTYRDGSDNITVYENTADNAHRVGWHYMPEYCFGRPTAKFVSHDHRLGTFTYVN